MPVLHNRVSQAELKKKLMLETDKRKTLSFYRYFPIPDPKGFRDHLYRELEKLLVFGRIYVAQEGINAQISVPERYMDALRGLLYSVQGLDGMRLNYAVDDDGKSFWVLKIKVREKIVADGITDPSFSMEKKGRYVDAAQMNELMDREGTVVIDMRNHYEYEVGHFDGALPIPSDTFREQLPMAVEMLQDRKDKNIIMYCTGGIRCEKASAYLLHNGFKNVFHLEGGIIHYASEASKAGLPSRFIGKNFVFDGRLGERITPDIIAQCHQCGLPADTHTNCRNEGCHMLFIQCPACAEKYAGCCSEACHHVKQLPEEEQKRIRKGIRKEQSDFNKAKKRLRPDRKAATESNNTTNNRSHSAANL
jgi:UPF0176 protein